MRLPDDSSLRKRKSAYNMIIFSAIDSQEKNNSDKYFINYNDEFFVYAKGVSENKLFAAKLACDTAVWAYKLIRLRNYYWEDKKLFLARIFRSTSLTLWQKRKDEKYESGLLAEMTIVITSGSTIWVGSVGETTVVHAAEKKLNLVYCSRKDNPAIVLGEKRYGIAPSRYSSKFEKGDILLIGPTKEAINNSILSSFENDSFSAKSVSELNNLLVSLVGSNDNNYLFLGLSRIS